MVESAKTMFFLSLGLLFVSAGSLVANEAKPETDKQEKTDEKQENEIANQDAENQSPEEAPEKQDSKNEGDTSKKDDTEEAKAEGKSDEPGYLESSWNSVTGTASDMVEFSKENYFKAAIMAVGIYTILNKVCSLFADEDVKTVRRRPRYSRPEVTE